MGKYKDNPWLGLESYQENQIIYGRNKEIEELSQCILNNNETVLYGKSGIGKSSIINAGILPVARANGYIPVVVRLDHSNKHSYIKQINDQICKFTTIDHCSLTKSIDEQLLWEYFHTREFKQTANAESKSKILIVFDQFEEIFTLQGNAAAKSQFFKEIADVLNDVMPKSLVVESKVEKPENTTQNTEETTQITGFASMTDLFSSIAAQVENANNQYIEDNDIHFVFTLREDFLSEFEYYTTRIPSLKQHRYGLRPINEEQAAEIIMKPRPDLVDEVVARLIIETVTNRTDFNLGDEPEIDVDAAVLSLFLSQIYDKRETEQDAISVNLVKTFGKDIIKDFYEESIEGLSSEQIDFLEEELLTGENRRDSLSRSDFKAGGFSEEELRRLIDEKKLLRQFHYEGDLRVEFIHDVLCDVVKERKEIRQQLRLQKIAEVEKAKAQREKLAAVRIRNISITSFILLFFVAVVALYFWNWYYNTPVSEYYSAFRLKNGWPIGVNEKLSDDEIHRFSVVYELKKNSRCDTLFTSIYVVNQHDSLTVNRLDNPLVSVDDIYDQDDKAREFAQLLSKVKIINFEASANNNAVVSKQQFCDINGTPLFSYAYEQSSNTYTNEQWCTFLDASGRPMSIRGEADRMRVFRDSLGFDRKYLFYSSSGEPCTNKYNWCYGLQFSEKMDTLMYLNVFGDVCGQMVNKREGNVLTEMYYGCESLAFDKRILTYNNNNDVQSIDYFKDDKPCCSQQNPAKVLMKYSKGRLIEEHYFDENDKPVSAEDDQENLINGYYSSCFYSYRDDTSDLIGYTYYDVDSKGKEYISYSYKKSNEQIVVQEYDVELRDLVTNTQMLKDGKIVSSKYEVNNSPIIHPKTHYHKSVINYSDEKINNVICSKATTKYYDIDNELCETEKDSIKYAIIEEWIDSKGNLIRLRKRDKDENIVKSMEYNYRDGVLFEQYVVGIEGKPIRCPKWDIDGLNYYKLRIARDFNGNISRLNPIGETRLSSLVYAGFDGQECAIIIKGEALPQKITDDGSWNLIELPHYIHIKDVREVQNRNVYRVNYIHLLHENALNAGLHDGDIIMGIPIVDKPCNMNSLLNNSNITIIRCERGIWHSIPATSLSLNLLKDNECEVYPIYINENEYNEILKSR